MSGDDATGLDVNIGLVSHAVASGAFLFLLALLAVGWRRGILGAWLMCACAITALWSGAAAYNATAEVRVDTLVWVLELLRSASWIAFLVAVLTHTWSHRGDARSRLLLPAAIAAFCVVNIGLDVSGWGIADGQGASSHFNLGVLGRLAIAIVGLLLVENLFRNTRPDQRWAVKFLCFGIGGMFSFDFYMFADALLLHRVDPNLLDARGLTNAVIVPLIAVSAARNPEWSLQVFVSRRFVFHSATLVGAGAYLLLMAAAGYYLRRFGGQWGPAVQALFLFAAIILLLLVVFSGGYRAWLRVNISKHFFNYKYDYRDEWLNVISTISSLQTPGGLQERVVEAIANILDSPEGAMWLTQDETTFTLATAWNCAVVEGSQTADPSFGRFLEEQAWVIDFDEAGGRPEICPDLPIPGWLSGIENAWLLVPLLHHDRLLGILLLGRPRVPVDLNWEDYDLLKTAARQAASYLAEQTATRALVESNQFDQFSRRFAFVIHDIKNLVSQLSLMLSNAKKHKQNPRFQDDMLETVQESVEKLNRLLVRLHEGGKEVATHTAIDLASFLRRVVERNPRQAGNLSFACQSNGLAVVADEDRLSAVLAHLIDNALDAAGADGTVEVRLGANGAEAVIEVEDDGPGMDPDFVRNELFRPFRTTKSGGYGIGAYESREFVRELGGRLDVTSRVGSGTTIRMSLPAIRLSEDPEPAMHGEVVE